MLENITWTQFVIAVVILTVVYYLVIVVTYFRKDINKKLTGKHKRNTITKGSLDFDQSSQSTVSTPLIEDEETDLLIQQANELSNMLKDCIQTAANKKYSEEELFTAIQIQIRKFPELNKRAFRVAIYNVIVTECKRYSTHTPSEERMEIMWRDGV